MAFVFWALSLAGFRLGLAYWEALGGEWGLGGESGRGISSPLLHALILLITAFLMTTASTK